MSFNESCIEIETINEDEKSDGASNVDLGTTVENDVDNMSARLNREPSCFMILNVKSEKKYI